MALSREPLDPGAPKSTAGRQDEDGRPYLSVFLDGVSFIWSGDFTEPIEVCPGGAGEAVAVRFSPLTALDLGMDTEDLLVWVTAFGAACQAWLDDADRSS